MSARALSFALFGMALVACSNSGMNSASQGGGAVATSLDGPGTYYVFRTLPHNPRTATPEQAKRCDDYFGPRAPTNKLVQTNALGFSFLNDLSGGPVSGETKTYLGPGFICVGPGATPDLTEAYAYATIPGAGETEAHGTCALSPSARSQAGFTNCQLDLNPKPDLGMAGGFAASNTVSGSIFAAYVVMEPGRSLPRIPPPPRIPDAEIGSLPNDPDFWVFRSFGEATPESAPECDELARAGALVTGVRTINLSATQPDLNDARLDPREPLRQSAKLTLCFVQSLPLPVQLPVESVLPYPAATGAGGQAVLARIEVQRKGQPIKVDASGYCRHHATPAGAEFLLEACGLSLTGSSDQEVNGGLLTSIGLVSAAAPATVANSQVWSLSLLPPTAPSEGGGGLLCAPGAIPAIGGQCAPVDPTAGGG